MNERADARCSLRVLFGRIDMKRKKKKKRSDGVAVMIWLWALFIFGVVGQEDPNAGAFPLASFFFAASPCFAFVCAVHLLGTFVAFTAAHFTVLFFSFFLFFFFFFQPSRGNILRLWPSMVRWPPVLMLRRQRRMLLCRP